MLRTAEFTKVQQPAASRAQIRSREVSTRLRYLHLASPQSLLRPAALGHIAGEADELLFRAVTQHDHAAFELDEVAVLVPVRRGEVVQAGAPVRRRAIRGRRATSRSVILSFWSSSAAV